MVFAVGALIVAGLVLLGNPPWIFSGCAGGTLSSA